MEKSAEVQQKKRDRGAPLGKRVRKRLKTKEMEGSGEWRVVSCEIRKERIFTTEGTENTEGKKRKDRKRTLTTEGRSRLRGESVCGEEGSGQWRGIR